MKPETKGFQKPIDSGKRREVRLAVITYGESLAGTFATCSCGAVFRPHRPKVLEDHIDNHLNKKHGGRGIRI